MTKIVPSMEKNVARNDLIDLGIASSIVLISLENLFTIRPMGVVSKKDIGERRILSKS